jgi:non-ribosomal peptide synthetase component F
MLTDSLRDLWDAPLTLALPYDRPRPATMSGRGSVHWFDVPQRLVERLETVARRCGTTLYAVLLAATTVLLSRLSGQTDMVLASNVANRTRVAHESIVGLFVNNLALRARLEPASTFAGLVGRLSRTFFVAMDRQSLPFGMLAEALQRGGRDPLGLFPQVVFVLENAPDAELELTGLTSTVAPVPIEGFVTDLCFVLIRGERGIRGAVEHPTDLFDPGTIARWARALVGLLEEVAGDPDRPLGEYELGEAPR